jgi:hypothetical protein
MHRPASSASVITPSSRRRHVGRRFACAASRLDGHRSIIDPTRLDEFEALASELLQITDADDGVLQYEWYLSGPVRRVVTRPVRRIDDGVWW